MTRPETEVVGDWVVKGRVLDAGEKPVAGARITLKSEDQDLVQRFGEIRTGEDGRYEKSFSGKDLAAVFKRASKARLVVTSPDGKLTTTTTELQPEADKIHAFDLRLKSPKKKG